MSLGGCGAEAFKVDRTEELGFRHGHLAASSALGY